MGVSTYLVSRDARYLTVGQLAERFSICPKTIDRWMATRGFPKPVPLGGGPKSHRRWLLADVERWEAEREPPANDIVARCCASAARLRSLHTFHRALRVSGQARERADAIRMKH